VILDDASSEAANQFLRDRYITEFNRRFSKPAAEKATGFRRCARHDLDEVFSIQTERTVAKDNTVTIRDRHWQLDRTPFRRTLAGCTVTICESHVFYPRQGGVLLPFGNSIKAASAVNNYNAHLMTLGK
jgi:hypothetical protein